MLVSLITGKVVSMSIEQFLGMDDEDFQNIIAQNHGRDIGNPFEGSVLKDGEVEDFVFPNTIEEEVLLEDSIEKERIDELESIDTDFDEEYFNNDELEK